MAVMVAVAQQGSERIAVISVALALWQNLFETAQPHYLRHGAQQWPRMNTAVEGPHVGYAAATMVHLVLSAAVS